MANENEFMFHALLMGIFITFIYDCLRILRRVIPHRNFLVSLEDILFWIYCAYKVFLLMYHESDGKLRWFAVLGALTGMLLYLRLISPIFVKYVSLTLQKVLRMLLRVVKILCSPLFRLAQVFQKKLHNIRNRWAVKRQKHKELHRSVLKKRLTMLWKMLKMNL